MIDADHFPVCCHNDRSVRGDPALTPAPAAPAGLPLRPAPAHRPCASPALPHPIPVDPGPTDRGSLAPFVSPLFPLTPRSRPAARAGQSANRPGGLAGRYLALVPTLPR